MKPGTSPLQSTRLHDQVREWVQYLHYSFAAEKVYIHRIKSQASAVPGLA